MDDNVKVKLEAAYESNNSIKPVKRLDEWLKECKSRNLINDNYIDEKSILVFSHQLSRTGAPIVLLDLVRIMKKEGYKVAVISFMDGSLKEEYKKEGIPVLVYNSKYINEELIDVLSRYFGTWFINTLVLWTFVAYAKNRHIKVIWWMHENEQFYQIMQKEYCKLVKTKNMRFLAAGPYVQRMISTYMNTESEILNFGVKEERGTDAIQAYYNEHNIVRFLLAGTLSSLKGIDVLAEAIRTLPEVYHERSEYIFVGNMSTAEEGILEDLLTLDNEYDNVKIYDSLNHDDIYRLYDKVSVVVVPSRLEPTSAVAVEGLMKRKICICTDI